MPKKKVAQKNITTDKLARMIQKGFDETAKKTDMDRQFKSINKRLDKIEEDIVEIKDLIRLVTSEE